MGSTMFLRQRSKLSNLSCPKYTFILTTCMKFPMLFFSHHKKVFNAIIIHNSVNVVNDFKWFKRTSNMVFHYKSMFRNIFSLISLKTIWVYNCYISTRSFNLSRFPSPSFGTDIFFFKGIRYILFAFFRLFSSLSPSIFSFKRGTHFLFSFLRKFNHTLQPLIPRCISFFGNTITLMRTEFTKSYFNLIRFNFKSFITYNTFFNHWCSPFENIITWGI